MEPGASVLKEVDVVMWGALTNQDAQTALLAKAKQQGFEGDTLTELAQALVASPKLQNRAAAGFPEVDAGITL